MSVTELCLSDLSLLVCDGCPRGGGARLGLVGAVGVLRPLQLHFESLHADLEAVH